MENEQGALNPLSITDLLGKVMSSPEIMGAVASLLTMLKEPPTSSQETQSTLPPEKETEPAKESEAREAKNDAVQTFMPSKPHFSSQKREILSAIRPYMSERRCQMIDRMVHAADLVQLLKRR